MAGMGGGGPWGAQAQRAVVCTSAQTIVNDCRMLVG
jgi:hypothetical protein